MRAQAPTTGWRGEFIHMMNGLEGKYTQLANAMPWEKYSWRPGAGVRSVCEVFLHIGGDNYSEQPAPLGGGAPSTLAAGLDQPWGIAADGTSVYWADLLDGTILKVASGGGPVVTLACGQGKPAYVAVDDTSVYWTANEGPGAVMRLTPK